MRCQFRERIHWECDVLRARKVLQLCCLLKNILPVRTSVNGDPFDRDAERVRRDVELGFVSREAARRDYGVAIDDHGAVDEAATAKIRARWVKGDIRADFDFGPEREAWERVFDDETMCELNRRLFELPKSIRQDKRRWIIERAVPDLPLAGKGSLADVLIDADGARRRLKQAMAQAFDDKALS